MITLEEHICELRAELRGCDLTLSERIETEAELANAIAKFAKLEHELDGEFDIQHRENG